MRSAPLLFVTLVAACSGGSDDEAFDPDGGTTSDGAHIDGGGSPDQGTQPPGVSIRFDYRFDHASWFTPARRLVLEAAATEWSDRFGDDFPDIPLGTSLRTRDPENPTAAATSFDSTEVIDDLLV
ncbi:MAG: hypothetical protein H6Q90_6963, partial [Deltaproteobacteria bacterium]|nr:hypothetical protein [Deltaproteobacteria bacterium]